jgi:hypothetical protein
MIGEAGRSVVGPLAKINRPALATLSELPPATAVSAVTWRAARESGA